MEQLILTMENVNSILAALDAALRLSNEGKSEAAFYAYHGKLDAYNRVIGMATEYTKKIVYDIPAGKHVIEY